MVEGKIRYRDTEGFKEALEPLQRLSKGQDSPPEMQSAVQLITHLSWRAPDDTVSWHKGTLQDVMDYADSLSVGEGTLLRTAMNVALRHAEAAATPDQTEVLEVLAKIIRQHGPDPDSPTSRHPGVGSGQEQKEMGTNQAERMVEVDDARKPRAIHHRIYPYMDSVTQYAIDRGEDLEPWIVRDRSAARRTERLGEGRAMVRVWTPSAWTYVTDEPEVGDE